MPGPRGPRGPKPKIKNPGKLFARLMGFIFKKYLPACIIVVICIFVSVLANVQGTMFTKNLIDDYIVPLLKTGSPDYGPLLAAMGRVAVFYGIGVISTFAYSKIMIYVSQGTIKNLRVELFPICRICQSDTLTHMRTAISCQFIQTISIHSASSSARVFRRYLTVLSLL